MLVSLDREVQIFNFPSGISVAAGLISQESFSVQPLMPLLILPSVLQLFSSTPIPLFLFPAYLLNTSELNCAARMALFWGIAAAVKVQ